MMFPQSFRQGFLAMAGFALLGALSQTMWGQAGAPVTLIPGATFGEVVSLGGPPSDLVLDEARGRVYAVNSGAGRVNIYDYKNKVVTGSILAGIYPSAAALSMDSRYLYVTNTGSTTLSVIDLEGDRVIQTVSLPAKPEGVAVGIDGRVLITTQGTGAGNAQNTLLIFDPTLQAAQQVYAVASPPPISTPNPLPAVFIGRPSTPFPGRLIRTPDGQFIVGMVAINQTTTSAQTTLFVYESASGTVLRNRTVTGQSTVLSISPDGSRFMAGSTLYDTATLGVIGQINSANFPFFLTTNSNPAIQINFNYGGSLFTPDGSGLYSSFNVGANSATVRPVSNYFLIGSSRNLGIRLGLRMPESILGKMASPSSGAEVFAASESGIIRLPLDKLFEQPILVPDSTTVFLANDPCNKGIARAAVHVDNLGAGKLTYTVPAVTTALIAGVDTGVAPSTITFTMEPGRTNVVRQPGTNIFTGAANTVGGTGAGNAININLSSREAVNFPNVIRVFMNVRQPDQRGIIYPVATGLTAAEGLQELLLDEARGRVYITNAALNRIEVFDIHRQRFLEPIETGQLPHSMAMSLDHSTLYVGNSGGESISIVDLDLRRETGSIAFPPIPRPGNQAVVRPVSLAMTQAGLHFVMSNGGIWRVLGNEATPRPHSTVIAGASATSTLGNSTQHRLAATPEGDYLIALSGSTGNGYLYDAKADAFTVGRTLFQNPIQSYYGPLSASQENAYFLANGLILSPSLAVVGGVERPSTTTATGPIGPGQPGTITTVSNGQRHVASVYSIDRDSFLRLTLPVRQNLTSATRDEARPTLELTNIRTGAATLAAVAPENPPFTILGTQRIAVPPRQLAADSKGNAYQISVSGLSVIALSESGALPRPSITGGARGFVNANTGTQSFTPGAFITVNGADLAAPATADQLPMPTVLGGSCVTLSDVPLPLLESSPGQMTAQIPDTLLPGIYVAQVRSLTNATQSDPIVITVQRPR